jgi:alcohol dehydrogenase class IV
MVLDTLSRGDYFMFKEIVSFTFPTTIIFGQSSLKQLPQYLSELGMNQPLIVTDGGFVKTVAFQKAASILQGAGIDYRLFSNIHPNPFEEDIEQALRFYRYQKCHGVIGLGGGSSMDAAKALTVLAANKGQVSNYDVANGGNQNIRGPLPPLVAIPTTSGTGSEVGRCSVISSKALGRKFMVCHPLMMPAMAILDPELTLELPPFLTAATGMDAFSHCLESLTSPVFHPLCDAIAVKGIELIVQYLERAFNTPTDVEARGYMQLASMMGAVAFQKDLGAAHSIAHALSAVCQTHHGLANAICMVPVMKFNRKAAAKQYSKVASSFGVNTIGMTDLEAADKAIECIGNMVKRLKLPATLRKAGVEESDLPEIAQIAFKDPCHKTNPRSCSEDDLLGILKYAF